MAYERHVHSHRCSVHAPLHVRCAHGLILQHPQSGVWSMVTHFPASVHFTPRPIVAMLLGYGETAAN